MPRPNNAPPPDYPNPYDAQPAQNYGRAGDINENDPRVQPYEQYADNLLLRTGTATTMPGWASVNEIPTGKPKPKSNKTTRETRIDYIMMAHKILSSTRNKTIDDVLNTAEAIEVYVNSGPRKAASRENVEGISLD